MSFAVRHLSVLAYTNGFTHWLSQNCNLADVIAPDFFTDARDMIAVGDIILVSARDGAAQLWVASADPSVVIQLMSSTGAVA